MHIPALWLLPSHNKYGDWPASGEMDMIESRGNIDLQNETGTCNTLKTLFHLQSSPIAAVTKLSMCISAWLQRISRTPDQLRQHRRIAAFIFAIQSNFEITFAVKAYFFSKLTTSQKLAYVCSENIAAKYYRKPCTASQVEQGL